MWARYRDWRGLTRIRLNYQSAWVERYFSLPFAVWQTVMLQCTLGRSFHALSEVNGCSRGYLRRVAIPHQTRSDKHRWKDNTHWHFSSLYFHLQGALFLIASRDLTSSSSSEWRLVCGKVRLSMCVCVERSLCICRCVSVCMTRSVRGRW